MCMPGMKTPYTPQTPQQPNQGQVDAQLQRMSTAQLGMASTILTNPAGTAPAPTATKTLIGQ